MVHKDNWNINNKWSDLKWILKCDFKEFLLCLLHLEYNACVNPLFAALYLSMSIILSCMWAFAWAAENSIRIPLLPSSLQNGRIVPHPAHRVKCVSHSSLWISLTELWVWLVFKRLPYSLITSQKLSSFNQSIREGGVKSNCMKFDYNFLISFTEIIQQTVFPWRIFHSPQNYNLNI